MSALTINAARITDNPVGEVVLAGLKPIVTRTSALSGYRVDMLQRGYTPVTMVRPAEQLAN